MDKHELKSYALEFGFCDAALCSIASFDVQRQNVLSQPPLSERKQLCFDPIADDPQMRSIAVLLWPYSPGKSPKERQVFVDSYYQASNAAYHAAIRLEQRLTNAGYRAKANVSYPAKEAAVRAGLGMIGDHSLLIHPEYGTRVAIILMTTDIPADQQDASRRLECLHCGLCSAVCPVGAIDSSGMSHPERCLRNFMMGGSVVPEEFRPLMENRMIGCDACQRVCPMQKCEIQPPPSGHQWSLDEFVTDDQAAFSDSVKRLALEIGRNTARPQRVRSQAALLCGCIGDERDLPVLMKWSESEFESVKAHSLWAIRQIQSRCSQERCLKLSGLDQNP